MAGEYPSIDISHDPELLQVVEEVRKTKKAQTVQIAEGVVAVVKPGKQPAHRRSPRQRPSGALSSRTVEEVFGAVPTPPHLHGKDIDEMIREAKEERAGRLMQNMLQTIRPS
jgi:hypothetical protein